MGRDISAVGHNQIGRLIDDRPGDGIFQLDRAVYTDREIFELEMKFIFERSWNFLCMEAQISKPFDFVTLQIGRAPVLVTRDAQGKIGAFLNVCRHKGALVCRTDQGSAKVHNCPYHGWTYDSSGKCVHIKDREAGAYAASFDAQGHDLVPLLRLQSYRGFIFGSLSPDVPDLEAFLGDSKLFLDLVADQGPNGIEVIPGRSTYVFQANWKLQLDNGLDPYHLTSTHLSFLDIQARRRAGLGNVQAKQFDWSKRPQQASGSFLFPNGHSVFWADQAEPEKRPIFPVIDEVRKRVGDMRADWMLKGRIALWFPNMQIADAVALILRVFRPIDVNRTEMRSYCLAPVGEDPKLRAWRLRQFEDFFNPSGLATPDDTVLYESVQQGLNSPGFPWLQGYSRGMTLSENSGQEETAALGISPTLSKKGTYRTSSEANLHGPYREWRRLLEAGLAGQAAYP